ncbi:TMV resistance protein N-like [Quercus robur]|uniref:TMV resistance protein N-like n=1 Tax=Quercus robur TaxID=38942 RepID=UPI0021634563|nr:TMV resistance protein N-like [Quercus robur]XP_050254269.1 TMV resistance protein N-like [Quercus robur]XP_050254270.1 TMV resistance protein N-like [Quercus robur]XP_050254271.1 TMV resistance protein N-like [Quercus robur]XP_050254273.1 TMV resistance protein N-like [Quercus robur]XP_050254274.1 TMV resistance protein N-like [Quercus robur]
MDSNSPSSSFSSGRKWKYDVFLSFRGEDTRKSFTDHLYTTLKQKGIFAFRDNEELERGKPIKPELLEAIEESLYAIVILSKNYASSTWCLDELVKIVECKDKIGLIVHPIFYDVEPYEVRKQTGFYAQAFVKHEKENIDKVQKWRAALKEVANLSGLSLHDRYESEFIQDIVESISHKLRYRFPKDTKGLVGIDSRVEDLMSLLAIGSNDVFFVGIWGMGGIGKTTLARVVYEMVLSEFEGHCFIANVRGESEKCGLLPLQQKLIREILMEESVNIRDDYDGVDMIKNRLCHKKILLVLDDVNQFNQLEKLVGDSKWFGQGSRVIITTRDEHLIRHKVNSIYEAQGMNDIEALRLFSLKAFKEYDPPKDYLSLSTSFIDYAKGLPLAIDVLGSFLYDRSKEEWEGTLNRLKEYPNKKIIEILEIGFDGLQGTEKEIFLYIACFFNMKAKNYIVEILDYLGLHPKIGLKVLIERSLLKYYENKYWMHDLLQQMGQDMVRRDCPLEPEKWSKLWLYKDIRSVLMKNMEMEAVQGLVLQFGELYNSEKAHWNLEAFPKMPNLKLLIIHDVQLLHGPKHLSNNLRFLDWSGYPSKSLPSNFQPVELVELHLLHSKIEWLWKGTKYLDKLKLIKLNNSLNLFATPDFTGIPNLEKLVLDGCIKLHEVHPSIMFLKRLTLLDLENCKSLRSLPSKFEMESLEILILSGCSKIKRIPEFMVNMKHVSKLHLNGTAITKLPSSIEHLTNLDSLHLRDCKNLVCLPSIIYSFKSLKDINLAGCSKLDGLPEKLWNVESLEKLNASGITLREPPSSVVTLENLKKLSLQGCKGPPHKLWKNLFSLNLMPRRSLNPVSLLLPYLLSMGSLKKLDLSDCNLETIPNDIGNLSSITKLNLSGNHFSSLPESMVQLSKLERIELFNCTRLRSLPQLPSTFSVVEANNCDSLEMFPNGFKSFKFFRRLSLINCFKYVGQSDMSSNMLGMLLKAYEKIYKKSIGFHNNGAFTSVILGSEIPKWFTHQSEGDTVSAQVTHQNENKWIGIVVCVVPMPCLNCESLLHCVILSNEHRVSQFYIGYCPRFVKIKLDHLWSSYIPSQAFSENERAVLGQIDENGFIQMKLKFLWDSKIKKCGFRVVYEQDIEDIREIISAQSSSNTFITPYEGLVVHHNSTEGIKLKRSRGEYDGEGSSNNVLHSKRIER